MTSHETRLIVSYPYSEVLRQLTSTAITPQDDVNKPWRVELERQLCSLSGVLGALPSYVPQRECIYVSYDPTLTQGDEVTDQVYQVVCHFAELVGIPQPAKELAHHDSEACNDSILYGLESTDDHADPLYSGYEARPPSDVDSEPPLAPATKEQQSSWRDIFTMMDRSRSWKYGCLQYLLALFIIFMMVGSILHGSFTTLNR